MRIQRIGLVVGIVAALLLPVWLRAQEPPHYRFSPAPRGTVTQSELGYLGGQAMHSQWRAVASKRQVARVDGQPFYQQYLSIYAIDGASTYDLKYRSPGNGGPLSMVEKAHGGAMWFPLQTLSIVGYGQFQFESVDDLVVASHETGADCGGAQITIFTVNPKTAKVRQTVTINNGCALTAKIVRGTGGDSLVLTGPYYGPNAAMCCPTKNSASATLRFRGGKWKLTPAYFTLKTA